MDLQAQKNFRSNQGNVPHPRTEAEWMEKNYTSEQAKHRVAQDVFGHDFKTDAKGQPIEQGRGSVSNQTDQHRMAIAHAEGAREALRSKAGWSPSLVGAFDPKFASLSEERARKALALLEQHEAAEKAKK